MGNPRNETKTRQKNQALTVKSSKPMLSSAIGGGAPYPEAKTLKIPLNRLDVRIVDKARVNAKVVLKLQAGQYEVYLKDERLGTIPGNYTSALLPKNEYRGRIIEVSTESNPIVIIEVSNSNNQR